LVSVLELHVRKFDRFVNQKRESRVKHQLWLLALPVIGWRSCRVSPREFAQHNFEASPVGIRFKMTLIA